MDSPTFDKDGYPSEETLDAIRNWPFEKLSELFDFIGEGWEWGDKMWIREGNKITANTGGWSGNESLIGALGDNFIAWSLCWVLSSRGGHFEFEIREIKGKENE